MTVGPDMLIFERNVLQLTTRLSVVVVFDVISSRVLTELVFSVFNVIKTSAPNPTRPKVLREEILVWPFTVRALEK